MNISVSNLFSPNPAVGPMGDQSRGTGRKMRTTAYLCSPQTSTRDLSPQRSLTVLERG